MSGIRPTNSPYLQIEYLIEKIVHGNIQYLFQLKILNITNLSDKSSYKRNK